MSSSDDICIKYVFNVNGVNIFITLTFYIDLNKNKKKG